MRWDNSLLTVCTETKIREDGKIQSYCGLKLCNIDGLKEVNSEVSTEVRFVESQQPLVRHSYQNDDRQPTDQLPERGITSAFRLCSETTLRSDGKIQSYCGFRIESLDLSDISTAGIDFLNTNGLQTKVCGIDDISDQRSNKRIRTIKPVIYSTADVTQAVKVVSRQIKRPSGIVQTYYGLQISQITPTGNDIERIADTLNRHPSRQAYLSHTLTLGILTVCGSCGASMWLKERTSTEGTQRNPKFNFCCQNGKVVLPTLNDAPLPLRKLLDYDEPKTAQFREQIRTYNSMFCFTSFGAKIDHSVNRGRAPYTFRISGKNYHKIGSLVPAEGTQPKYAQLYFYDTQNEIKNRMSAFMNTEGVGRKTDSTLVESLLIMLNKHSAVAKAFRMARDWCETNNGSEFQLKLIGQRSTSKQYNAPTVSEIAVLITDDFGEANTTTDVVVCSKKTGLKRISELHQLYMTLQYPLLFPYGESGFHEHICYNESNSKRKIQREYVTMREYYCYRIQYRNGEGTTLLRGGRLLQQYLVDAYTAVEEQRLTWMRHHQTELRVDLYNNVCDAVTRGDTRADAIGQRIVLPASFTGGPRYMVQNYQDAMAICRTYGNPGLFITFTANPKWPEIETSFAGLNGQNASDRPQIVSRVFKLKLNDLMDDITKKHLFGKYRAGVYTIEFQKRGLPHAHMLIWLEDAYKCKTPNEINDIISAEIPSSETDPEGYKAVTDYMIHGPCGVAAKHASCMVEGKCSRHFPRSYYNETTIDEDGYPVYRRRNDNVTIEKNKIVLDNRSVVPYNRHLLIKYAAHINVEWCNRSRAIKYLFKYLTKGPDRATMVVQENVTTASSTNSDTVIRVDEIKSYLDCRYLSACEAVWRLFSFDIHYSFPSVIKLSFHLQDQHSVTLHDSQKLTTLLNREGIKDTMFSRWFDLNKSDPRAKQLTYAEIPTEYVWHEMEKTWKRRKRGTCIGRIVYCHPAAGPKYYLRLLLTVVRGPECYEDIRTVNGYTFSTFKEACFAYGLISDDKEWLEAITEASTWATGSQLRDLFVTMLLMCEVTHPLQLWEDSWKYLSEDILHNKRRHFRFPNLQLTELQLQNYCLVEIQERLARVGKVLTDFPGLPSPDPTLLTKLDNRLIREELNYNMQQIKDEYLRLSASLNTDQLRIFNHVIDSVEQGDGGFYFVYGPGGTGKTFLYKAILSNLRSKGIISLAVASSGITSLLLPGGRTAHSRFAIPLEIMENSTCGIKQNTHLSELMQEVKLIIWDEAPMTKKHAFEALDKTFKDILGYKTPANRSRIFGGMTMLLGGDFRQILPVIEKGKRQEIVQASVSKSYLWKYCKLFTLSRSMRVNEYSPTGELDIARANFNKWVLDVGDGNVPATKNNAEDEPTWIKIPHELIVHPSETPIHQFVDIMYPSFSTEQHNEAYLRERAILTPKNDDADEINDHMFNMLDGQTRIYKSSDEICKASTDASEQQQLYPTEFLNTLTFSGMPPHTLKIKEGMPVMLLRNVNPSEGLCNGTRLIITHSGKFVLKARIITGSKIGNTTLIPRINLTSTKSKWPFIMKRRQYPIKACFAMTINKSQGQSLNHVGVYLPSPVFSHGQLYVALSRVTTPEGLRIMLLNNSDNICEPQTRNIVYKEVFSNLFNNDQ